MGVAVRVGVAVGAAVGDGLAVAGLAVPVGVAVGVPVGVAVGVGVAAVPQAPRSKVIARNRNKAIFLTAFPFCIWIFSGLRQNCPKSNHNFGGRQTLAGA